MNSIQLDKLISAITTYPFKRKGPLHFLDKNTLKSYQRKRVTTYLPLFQKPTQDTTHYLKLPHIPNGKKTNNNDHIILLTTSFLLENTLINWRKCHKTKLVTFIVSRFSHFGKFIYNFNITLSLGNLVSLQLYIKILSILPSLLNRSCFHSLPQKNMVSNKVHPMLVVLLVLIISMGEKPLVVEGRVLSLISHQGL